MRVSAIVAMSENRVIGINNRLPWRLPADLQHFKQITLGNPIVMGRKTFESIGRPLPGRVNIVITRDRKFIAKGCTVVHSLETVFKNLTASEEIFIIGGAELYRATFDRIDYIYLTVVHAEIEGDVCFPDWNLAEWEEVKREFHPADEANLFDYSFIELKRIK